MPPTSTLQELTRKVAIFYWPEFLITIHRTEQPFLTAIMEEYRNAAPPDGMAERRKGFLPRLLIDMVNGAIATYQKPLEEAETAIDRFEATVFGDQEFTGFLRSIYLVKRRRVPAEPPRARVEPGDQGPRGLREIAAGLADDFPSHRVTPDRPGGDDRGESREPPGSERGRVDVTLDVVHPVDAEVTSHRHLEGRRRSGAVERGERGPEAAPANRDGAALVPDEPAPAPDPDHVAVLAEAEPERSRTGDHDRTGAPRVRPVERRHPVVLDGDPPRLDECAYAGPDRFRLDGPAFHAGQSERDGLDRARHERRLAPALLNASPRAET